MPHVQARGVPVNYRRFRRVQSPPRRVNAIVVEEVERHGCRESHGGPWMAHRGGPLERRWSERTLAQPGPDDRAEGFGYFCRKSDSPGKAKPNLSRKTRQSRMAPRKPTDKLASPVSACPHKPPPYLQTVRQSVWSPPFPRRSTPPMQNEIAISACNAIASSASLIHPKN